MRALPSDTELGAADRDVQDICNQIRQDFANTSEITYQKSGNTVRTVLTMIPTGETGEAGSVSYDFIGDASMIRRRTDANAYEVLSSSLSRYSFSRSETDGRVDYLTIRLEFDDTIQGVFELFIRTPYKPELK